MEVGDQAAAENPAPKVIYACRNAGCGRNIIQMRGRWYHLDDKSPLCNPSDYLWIKADPGPELGNVTFLLGYYMSA